MSVRGPQVSPLLRTSKDTPNDALLEQKDSPEKRRTSPIASIHFSFFIKTPIDCANLILIQRCGLIHFDSFSLDFLFSFFLSTG